MPPSWRKMVLVKEVNDKGMVKMARSSICSICQKRPIGSGNGSDPRHAKTMGYCAPCLEEAEWENMHSDDDHEGDATDEEKAGCWICFPELNRASDDYKERMGSTRAGMVIHVTIRAAGVTKAEQTIAHLSDEGQNGRFTFKIVKPSKRNGQITKLAAISAQETFEASWDDRGRFLTGSVTEDGKTRKVRNVAEIVRLAK
jgi:hypothetical protein